MYCKVCGNEINEQQSVCLNCGCFVNENTSVKGNKASDDMDLYYQKLSEYEKISGVVWLVIAILQICSLIGIVCGIWNIFAAITRMKFSIQILEKPTDLVKRFENQLTEIIIIMVLNIFFGAVFGVVGSIVDLFVRNYVIEHRNAFA